MLDIKFIRENQKEVKKNCENRNIKCDIDKLLQLDEKRKNLIQYVEELNAEKNKLNILIQKSSGDERKELIGQGKSVKEKLEKSEPELTELMKEFNKILLRVPNMTHPNSPIGKDDSKEVERYGEILIFRPRRPTWLGTKDTRN